MKVTTTPSPRSTVVLEVELPAARVQRSIDESVRHLGRRTRVPGFRPGKVPRPMLERALGVRRGNPDGPNPIHEDAKEHLFEASVVEAVREADLDPLAIPAPEWTVFEEGRGATYRVTLPLPRDGQPIEGIQAERFPLVIGAERMIPGFEAQLIGLREGDEKDFALTFPDD